MVEHERLLCHIPANTLILIVATFFIIPICVLCPYLPARPYALFGASSCLVFLPVPLGMEAGAGQGQGQGQGTLDFGWLGLVLVLGDRTRQGRQVKDRRT